MKAKVVQSRCVGCAICANICPTGIDVMNGKATIKDENAECLKDAANACPSGAIILGDEQEFNNQGNANLPFNPGFSQGRGMGGGRRGGRGMDKRRGRGRRNL